MTNFFKKSLGTFLIFSVLAGVFPASVFAAPQGQVTLTFDDGWLDHYTNVAPILKAGGQTGTFYIAPGLVDAGTFAGGQIMSWSQVISMKNDGFEIGGHSVTHPELPEIPVAQMQAEVKGSYDRLVARGITPKAFATPFGAYNPSVVAEIAKYYDSHRGFHDIGYNTWPYNKYLLRVQQVTNQTTLAQIQGWIAQARQNGTWLIIVFHQVLPTVAQSDTYSWKTSDFQALVNYLNAQGIKTKTVSEVIGTNQNLLPNGNFDSGIAQGWVTDNATQVKVSTSTQGAVPTPKTSIQFTGSSANVHLFGPRIPVTAGEFYGIRAYGNNKALTGGEFGFYLDEYDAQGNWKSWKWLGKTGLNQVIDNAYVYIPASTIAFTEFKVYLDPGSVGSAFLDSVEIFKETNTPPPPPPTDVCPNIDGVQTSIPSGYEKNAEGNCVPIPPPDLCPNVDGVQETIPNGYEKDANGNCVPIPPPPTDVCPNIDGVQTSIPSGHQKDAGGNCVPIPPSPPPLVSLIPNSDFQNGIADGWRTNNGSRVVFDTSGRGIAPSATSSIRFGGGSSAVHLFSPLLAVTSGTSYSLAIFADTVAQTAGELGFYVDEYDAQGNWISGRWLGKATNGVAKEYSFTHTPSSANVKTISLQIYSTFSPVGTAYIDNARIFTP